MLVRGSLILSELDLSGNHWADEGVWTLMEPLRWRQPTLAACASILPGHDIMVTHGESAFLDVQARACIYGVAQWAEHTCACRATRVSSLRSLRLRSVGMTCEGAEALAKALSAGLANVEELELEDEALDPPCPWCHCHAAHTQAACCACSSFCHHHAKLYPAPPPCYIMLGRRLAFPPMPTAKLSRREDVCAIDQPIGLTTAFLIQMLCRLL